MICEIGILDFESGANALNEHWDNLSFFRQIRIFLFDVEIH